MCVTSYTWDQGVLGHRISHTSYKLQSTKQAGAELGQSQSKLDLELSFISHEICCIYLIIRNYCRLLTYLALLIVLT